MYNNKDTVIIYRKGEYNKLNIIFKGTYKEFKIWYKSCLKWYNPFYPYLAKIEKFVGHGDRDATKKEIEKIFWAENWERDYVCEKALDNYYFLRKAFERMEEDTFEFKWLKKVAPNLFFVPCFSDNIANCTGFSYNPIEEWAYKVIKNNKDILSKK